MKAVVLILLLNTWGGDGKGAFEKIEGFSSVAECKSAGELFLNPAWAQYYYCVEVQ